MGESVGLILAGDCSFCGGGASLAQSPAMGESGGSNPAGGLLFCGGGARAVSALIPAPRRLKSP